MGGAPKIPKPISPIDADLAAEKARERERERLRSSRGRSSTVLTGGLGDVSSPNLGFAVLTGQ